MTEQKTKKVQLIAVSVGECEYCGYDYAKDNLKIPADQWAVLCPRCGKYSQNWDTNTKIEADNYDFEKENNKKCPVCGKTIDYHIDGFIHYEVENVWVHLFLIPYESHPLAHMLILKIWANRCENLLLNMWATCYFCPKMLHWP